MSTDSPSPPPPPPSEPSTEVCRALESLDNPATMQNAEQFEAAGLAVMRAAAEWAEAHPSLDRGLEEELERQYAALDWPAALGTLRQLVARATDRGEHHQVFSRERQVSEFCDLLRQPEAAQTAARAATEAARRVDRMPIIVAVALLNEAMLNLEQGEVIAVQNNLTPKGKRQTRRLYAVVNHHKPTFQINTSLLGS